MLRLDADTLESLDFFPQEREDIAIDDPVASYKGFTIALCIPNGGILGVSFWDQELSQRYAKPTELLPDFPGYHAKGAHIALAEAAIDAATIETGQLSLAII